MCSQLMLLDVLYNPRNVINLDTWKNAPLNDPSRAALKVLYAFSEIVNKDGVSSVRRVMAIS